MLAFPFVVGIIAAGVVAAVEFAVGVVGGGLG